jgi:alkylated DNA repair protein (DNA oxidative demethylase)
VRTGRPFPHPKKQRVAAPFARRAHGPAGGRDPLGHLYDPEYLDPAARAEILRYLESIRPIWEFRYATEETVPDGRTQRRLLRPVYWLGNWQFACLDYYRPPRGTKERCVRAEPFPPVLARIARDAEDRARRSFPERYVPRGWHLNTCLINFYGKRLEDGRWVDSARVGEHRDFEPGPVASLSIGERALFQFVTSRRIGERDAPLLSQWLDDGSLQIFAGPLYKERALHRVQRVDRRDGASLPPELPDFRTRRVNFTFRYVPDADVVPYRALSARPRGRVARYVKELAERSEFFRRALADRDG